jgi:hypothetical protein
LALHAALCAAAAQEARGVSSANMQLEPPLDKPADAPPLGPNTSR